MKVFRFLAALLIGLLVAAPMALFAVQQDSEIITEVVIDAPPDLVWAVLSDFEHFGDWNPFIQAISGPIETGATLVARIALPGEAPMTIKPMVASVEPGRSLVWQGALWQPFIFSGEHAFRLLNEGEGRTRFSHSERFSGLLSGPVLSGVFQRTAQGFTAMNLALKARVEQKG